MPLRNLRSQALRVSKGQYAQVEPVNSKDEIGELSRAFNTMSSEIQQHIDALVQLAHIVLLKLSMLETVDFLEVS